MNCEDFPWTSIILYWPDDIFYPLTQTTLNLPLRENLFALLHFQINGPYWSDWSLQCQNFQVLLSLWVQKDAYKTEYTLSDNSYTSFTHAKPHVLVSMFMFLPAWQDRTNLWILF